MIRCHNLHVTDDYIVCLDFETDDESYIYIYDRSTNTLMDKLDVSHSDINMSQSEFMRILDLVGNFLVYNIFLEDSTIVLQISGARNNYTYNICTKTYGIYYYNYEREVICSEKIINIITCLDLECDRIYYPTNNIIRDALFPKLPSLHSLYVKDNTMLVKFNAPRCVWVFLFCMKYYNIPPEICDYIVSFMF